MVLKEAKKYTKYQTYITAMAMQETSCGVHLVGDLDKSVLNASLGILQFKITTAREVIHNNSLEKYYNYSDTRLATELLINHKLSIKLAALRFERLRKIHGYKRAIQSHNGWHGHYKYFKLVDKWKQWLLNTKGYLYE